jgi:hypothetical protein
MTEMGKRAGPVKDKKRRKNKKRLTKTITRDGKRLTKTTTIQNINHIKIHVGDKKTKSKTRTRPRGFVKPGTVGGGGGGNLSHRSMESEHSTNVMNNVYDVRNRAMNNQYMLENLYTNIGTLQNRIDGIGTQVLQRQQQPLMIDNNQEINDNLRIKQEDETAHVETTEYMDADNAGRSPVLPRYEKEINDDVVRGESSSSQKQPPPFDFVISDGDLTKMRSMSRKTSKFSTYQMREFYKKDTDFKQLEKKYPEQKLKKLILDMKKMSK